MAVRKTRKGWKDSATCNCTCINVPGMMLRQNTIHAGLLRKEWRTNQWHGPTFLHMLLDLSGVKKNKNMHWKKRKIKLTHSVIFDATPEMMNKLYFRLNWSETTLRDSILEFNSDAAIFLTWQIKRNMVTFPVCWCEVLPTILYESPWPTSCHVLALIIETISSCMRRNHCITNYIFLETKTWQILHFRQKCHCSHC